MIALKDLLDFLGSASPGKEAYVGIDGITLVILDAEGRETGDWIEVGGVPEEDEEEDR